MKSEIKKKVFILGAGASEPAGAPLINKFFPHGIFHLVHGTAFPDTLNNYSNFFVYLKNKYGFDINNPNPYKSEPFAFVENTRINIEQILSGIEDETSIGNKNMEDTRREAVRFVFVTLENAVNNGSNNNCYPDFVKNKIDIVSSESTIITFNYEIMLERELPRGYFSYGIDVDKDKIINFPGYEKHYKNNLLLLKLHGSLNWAVCFQCSKMYLFWSQRYDDISTNKCKSCNSNLESVLIPPARVKSNHLKNLYGGVGLEKLWKMAREGISLADEITIIGYSFGEYDFEANNLILDSVKTNIKKPILYIADPNAEKIYSKIANSVLGKNHFGKGCLFSGFKEYLKTA